ACHLSASRFVTTNPPRTAIYTLSLHDALPISELHPEPRALVGDRSRAGRDGAPADLPAPDAHPHALGQFEVAVRDLAQPLRIARSEEHTSELQSRSDLVCRLLLEKKKKNKR